MTSTFGRVLAMVLIATVTVGCAPADPTVAACLVADGGRQYCSETRGLKGEMARLYYFDHCQGAGGQTLDTCPREGAAGYCEHATPTAGDASSSTADARSSASRLEFRYVAPGSLAALVEAGRAPDCGGGLWHPLHPTER